MAHMNWQERTDIANRTQSERGFMLVQTGRCVRVLEFSGSYYRMRPRETLHRAVREDANCVGCVNGGMAYWNAVEKHAPEVYAQREALEEEFGHNILRGGDRVHYTLKQLRSVDLKRVVNFMRKSACARGRICYGAVMAKPKSKLYSEVVRTRLTRAERRDFEAAAAKIGLSVSAWLRSLAIRAIAEAKS